MPTQGTWKMLCDQVSLTHQANQDVKSLHEQPHHPGWNAVLRIHLPLRPRWILRLGKDLRNTLHGKPFGMCQSDVTKRSLGDLVIR